MVTRNKTS